MCGVGPGLVIMNTDGLECCDIKEQQQREQQNAFYGSEPKASDEIILINQSQSEGGASGDAGVARGSQDVVMEMAQNYSGWSASGAGGPGASGGPVMMRRVSFPKDNKNLVTGYMEPADPWANGECVYHLYYITGLVIIISCCALQVQSTAIALCQFNCEGHICF